MNYGDPFYFFNSHTGFFTKDSLTSSEENELPIKSKFLAYYYTLFLTNCSIRGKAIFPMKWLRISLYLFYLYTYSCSFLFAH